MKEDCLDKLLQLVSVRPHFITSHIFQSYQMFIKPLVLCHHTAWLVSNFLEISGGCLGNTCDPVSPPESLHESGSLNAL